MINDSDIVYWVWLSQVLGAGNPDVEYILSKFDSPKDLYDFGKKNGFYNIKFLSNHLAKKAEKTSIDIAQNIVNTCKKNNYEIITIKNIQYPNKLINIYSSPIILYISGNIDNIKLDNILSIAIVGARNCSDYARDVTKVFSSQLSLSGVAIISGMAVGIDSIALEEALNQNSKVISVLGCGLDIDYPLKNLALKKKIENFSNGCIISEYPPGTKPFASHFPVRNRIMAGLSNGVLVVEATERSGALVTAKIAIDQGKDIYGVPNNIFFENNLGVMNLLKDGAMLVTQPDDIINQYKWQYKFNNIKNTLDIKFKNKEYKNEYNLKNKINNNFVNKFDIDKSNKEDYNKTCDLNGILKDIFFLLLHEGPQNIDYISEKLNISVSELLINLTELELGGYIQNFPGMKYGINKLN